MAFRRARRAVFTIGGVLTCAALPFIVWRYGADLGYRYEVELIVPHHLPVGMRAAACQAGKHVAVQKPMALKSARAGIEVRPDEVT